MTVQNIEKWAIFEVSLEGPSDGNPYLDVTLEAEFSLKGRSIRVPGFYDGNGVYKLRFMPETEGAWSYVTRSSSSALDGHQGALNCVAPTGNNRGPVRVRNKFHFAYADGSPFLSFGTTCYAWTHQPLEVQEQTLQTLAASGFNKIRMGIFPKHYPYNTNEPLHDVYEVIDGARDFDRPNFESFRHFEGQIGRLMEMGIEADLIMFHPYDRWGYADMSEEQNYRYVAYIAARFGAYRNVWWALANEYDFLLNTMPMDWWDRYFQILEEEDPYRHLKSIHNGFVTANYDHRKPWVTHSCIQNWDVKQTQAWRDRWGKPVVNDEPEYEGNLIQSWGNISAQELVHRFWTTMMRGGYAGHGETYWNEEEAIWWAKGGLLHGEAWTRLKWMRELLEQDVKGGLEPLGEAAKFPWSRVSGAADVESGTTYIYLGEHQPRIWTTGLPVEDGDYQLDLIDTWNMTVTPLDKATPPQGVAIRHGSVTRHGSPDAAFAVELPGKTGLAIRCRRKG
ncbi:DUF5060 domain-containing protein [Tropicibacter sp. R15_0]|uniref:DUF5060 domain-containing protein n=1 Tax=Tropicibacter sp. R15_0 TaxID=2821101 RepID=UPI001ADA9EB0|nr:DUF5060 domain-containing protein [Tropicibacter sp. R15_0]MBO9467783.1 DUF5060 domain-containing protein [Tropicibacter sp. R15_0]